MHIRMGSFAYPWQRCSRGALFNSSQRSQQGFTLGEMLVVVAAMSVTSLIGWEAMSYYQDRELAANAAAQHLRVAQAALNYLDDHDEELADQLDNSRVERLDQIIDKGYLDDSDMGNSRVNPLGQQYRVYFYQGSSDDNPIQTLVVAAGDPATSPRVQHHQARQMGTTAAWVSEDGLMSPYYETFGYDLGTFGKANVAEGSVAWFHTFERQAATSDYLYRHAVAGFPELNQMATDLDMGGNSINNIDQVNAVTLHASQDVNADRDVNAGRHLSAAQDITAGQDIHAGADIRATQDLNAGQDVNATRDISADRDLDAGRYLHLAYQGHSEGQSCSGVDLGTVTIDSTGKMLSCQSGRWTGSRPRLTIAFDALKGRTTADTKHPSAGYIGVYTFCSMNSVHHGGGSDRSLHTLEVFRGGQVGDKYKWYWRNGSEDGSTKIRVTCYNL